MDQVGHNVITTTDHVGNRRGPLLNQLLGVIQPHPGPVGKTGNLQQLGVVLRVGVIQHPPDKAGPEFRQAKGPSLTLNLLFSHP